MSKESRPNRFYICHCCAKYKCRTTTDMARHYDKQKPCNPGYAYASTQKRDVLFYLSTNKRYELNTTRELTLNDYIYLVKHFKDENNVITDQIFGDSDNQIQQVQQETPPKTSVQKEIQEKEFVCGKCMATFTSKRSLQTHFERPRKCESNRIHYQNKLEVLKSRMQEEALLSSLS